MYPATLKISLSDGTSFSLIYVEGGEFLMGDDKSEYKYEKPAHLVKINSFYIGEYVVTQNLWQSVLGENPSNFKGANHPVDSVSWLAAHEFIQKLNNKTGKQFRLPTESEWEYTARGGINSQDYKYAGSDKLRQVGWYDNNSGYRTHEVGQLLANELGLYDMSGNVWEWCEDVWHNNYEGAPANGTTWVNSPNRGVYHVIRGGSYFNLAGDCRSAFRNGSSQDRRNGNLGFRLALPLQSVG